MIKSTTGYVFDIQDCGYILERVTGEPEKRDRPEAEHTKRGVERSDTSPPEERRREHGVRDAGSGARGTRAHLGVKVPCGG